MKLAYDGTNFLGWQVQKQQRTVQYVVEQALSEFSGRRTVLTGSGRTDAGVHATGQHAHFNYQGSANPEQIRKGLKRYLPDDIQVVNIVPVCSDFHARYDAMERCYRYIIAIRETPFNRLYQGSFPRKQIKVELMQKAAPYFLGQHDFSSFSKDNPNVPDHVCHIRHSDFEIREDCCIFTIRADRFLHNMVRRIVGALVNIGHLNLDPAIILTWLEQKQSRQTIIFPAPPNGLYLHDVIYPPDKICSKKTIIN
jgi:tRNA pseudouridine38-40 synthase